MDSFLGQHNPSNYFALTKERQENIDMYIKRLERYDDAYLIDRLHKASNMDERMALGYILKSRGYGPQK